MNNHQHGIARAINGGLLVPKFTAALQKAWCRETCWPGCVNGYPLNRDDNPSYGNCLVSVAASRASRAVAYKMRDDLIPGKIDEGSWHFRMGLKGYLTPVEVDPTWQQTKEGAVFRAAVPGTAEYTEIMKASLWDDQSFEPRLGLLIERMRTLAGFDLGYTAAQIVASLRERYKFVLEAADQAPQHPSASAPTVIPPAAKPV